MTADVKTECVKAVDVKRYPKEWLIAYDAFLWSEAIRHQENIDAIAKKRSVLKAAGFESSQPGPWITEREIIASGEKIRYNTQQAREEVRYYTKCRCCEQPTPARGLYRINGFDYCLACYSKIMVLQLDEKVSFRPFAFQIDDHRL